MDARKEMFAQLIEIAKRTKFKHIAQEARAMLDNWPNHSDVPDEAWFFDILDGTGIDHPEATAQELRIQLIAYRGN